MSTPIAVREDLYGSIPITITAGGLPTSTARRRLYADFDYPDEIEGLMRSIPAPPGAERGTRAIEQL
jgi:hypothetical protein